MTWALRQLSLASRIAEKFRCRRRVFARTLGGSLATQTLGRTNRSRDSFLPNPVPQTPRFLDQLRQAALDRFGRPKPGERFVEWTRRFILFHDKRHPRGMGADEVHRFFDHVARSAKAPLGSLELAHEALTFLYREFLRLDIGELSIPEPPRLLDRLRWAIRVRHLSPRTESCYVLWAERFIRFHGLRHPNTMGGAEIEMFLTNLAVEGHVAASTQNQAAVGSRQSAVGSRQSAAGRCNSSCGAVRTCRTVSKI